MDSIDDLPAFATVPQVARVLAISPNTVWRLTWRGELKAIRLGLHTIRIERAAVAEYLAEQRAATAASR